MQRNEGGNAIVSVPLAGTSFPKLDECVTALSSADPQMRATAAEALLDFPVTETRQGDRGVPWAYALIGAGAIVPLLGLVQAVKRDGAEGLKPCDCPGNTEPVLRAGDFALLVLTELAEVAAQWQQQRKVSLLLLHLKKGKKGRHLTAQPARRRAVLATSCETACSKQAQGHKPRPKTNSSLRSRCRA